MAIKKNREFLSGFDLSNYTKCSKQLKLNSQTIQAVCSYYAKSRQQSCKIKLRFRKSRGSRKSLGWVPFTNQNVKIAGNQLKFSGKAFKWFGDCKIGGKLKCGAFVQDSCGHWYVTLTCEIEDISHTHPQSSVGVDLGFKSIATTSDGEIFENPKLTNRYANKLAVAQRTGNKKRATRIHRKIARVRQDNLHKISSKLTKTYKHIVIGDLKLKASKSSNDSSYRGLISLLGYKASRLGGTVELCNEAYSTVTCSRCLERSGPTGPTALSVREWTCGSCGQTHDRDVNAAKNILRFGYEAPKTLGDLRENGDRDASGLTFSSNWGIITPVRVRRVV